MEILILSGGSTPWGKRSKRQGFFFLIFWPTTPSLRQHQHYLLTYGKIWLRGGIGRQFPGTLTDPNGTSLTLLTQQEGILYAHASTWAVWNATEAFSVNCLRSIPAFAGCFLELNDVYWVLHSTNMFFKVSRYFYDESEFIVASLSTVRGQSFLS